MRIHRIGQTKTVRIKRFIVKGSVEERMVGKKTAVDLWGSNGS
ncbi:hypothetical protein V2J09_010542 [Rumex salicifolius]